MELTVGRRTAGALAGLILGMAMVGPALAQDKPNILVIWGDDIGTWNISHNNRGMMGYETPNIDRIAREGHSASPTTTPSSRAPPAARRSSAARFRCAPA